jgi:hypothetical protein
LSLSRCNSLHRNVIIFLKVKVKFSRTVEDTKEDGIPDDVPENLDDEIRELYEKDQVLKEFKVDLDLTK